jgi:hypothetical protein
MMSLPSAWRIGPSSCVGLPTCRHIERVRHIRSNPARRQFFFPHHMTHHITPHGQALRCWTRIGLPPRHDCGGEQQKSDTSQPWRHDRPGLVAYLNWGNVASRRCGSLKTRMQEQDGEARWGLRRGDVLATIGARKAIAPVVRDSAAAANGIDLPKYLDVPKVRTMTKGSSAQRRKQVLRQGQTLECTTRKAKIKAKLERRRTMADQDLRR